jgi:hypothetical protein
VAPSAASVAVAGATETVVGTEEGSEPPSLQATPATAVIAASPNDRGRFIRLSRTLADLFKW